MALYIKLLAGTESIFFKNNKILENTKVVVKKYLKYCLGAIQWRLIWACDIKGITTASSEKVSTKQKTGAFAMKYIDSKISGAILP